MELWVGPAIVAALVSALVSAAGWFVTSWQAARLEQRRRDEKVHDFQVALRAEIASDRLGLVVWDYPSIQAEVAAAYREDAAYKPVVPHLASNVLFDAVVPEIHILPGEVIAAVIHYARLRQVTTKFIDDLRAAVAAGIPAERAVAMFANYFSMLERLEELAGTALAALDASLSKPAAGRSIQGPHEAAVPDEAPASDAPSPASVSALGETASDRKSEP